MSNESQMIGPLEELVEALRANGLQLNIGAVASARATRDELADQIGDYLIPRLKRLDAPLLVVLGGSTGSGKSTITNTLIGEEVSPAGVLRPTTRAPVLLCSPSDQEWFAGGDVLPELPRVTTATQTSDTAAAEAATTGTVAPEPVTGTVLRMVAVPTLDPGLAIIDAPDIDSVEEANRDLATQLLAAADMWLFATTAVRYADAVPWDFLRRAQTRGTSLAIIINRIPQGAAGEIVPHLQTMLGEAELTDVPIFPIEQSELTDAMLPTAAVADLRDLLTGLATDADMRNAVVRTTLDGAMDSVESRVTEVVRAAEEQRGAVDDLRSSMERVYTSARTTLSDDISSGNLLRGEVLDRWQELIGTAELMAAVQSRISMVRDRIGAFISGRPAATAGVQGEITSTLEQLLIDHADTAAASVTQNWKALPGGSQILDGDRDLERSSDEYRNTVAAEVRAWQDDILNLVTERGAGKRTTARVLAFGVNSIGVALMLVLFSQTGGLTGGEIAIGAGTAGVSQTLLSALFGEQAVRELAAEAKRLLIERVNTLLEAEANRYRTKLWTVADPNEIVDGLKFAAARYQQAR